MFDFHLLRTRDAWSIHINTETLEKTNEMTRLEQTIVYRPNFAHRAIGSY